MRLLLHRDQRGATIVEFGLLLPVLAALLMGALDMGHRLYMRAILQGAMQKAARDSALEGGSVADRQAEIDAAVREAVRNIHNGAAVTSARRAYRTFSDAARRHEEYTDTDKNGHCDNGEPYVDANGNGMFDADVGRGGQGGAQDVVVYSVRVVHPTITPVERLIGLDGTVDMTATAVLQNQPYNDQGSDGATANRNCP